LPLRQHGLENCCACSTYELPHFLILIVPNMKIAVAAKLRPLHSVILLTSQALSLLPSLLQLLLLNIPQRAIPRLTLYFGFDLATSYNYFAIYELFPSCPNQQPNVFCWQIEDTLNNSNYQIGNACTVWYVISPRYIHNFL
jgi:hypothetical protein